MRPDRHPSALDGSGLGGQAWIQGPRRPGGSAHERLPRPIRRLLAAGRGGMTALPATRPEEVGLSTARLRAMGAVLEERIAAGHLPGAVVLVARHGQVAWHEAHG